MPRILNYKENYKDEIFRLISQGEVVIKDEKFNFVAESRIPFKLKKGDYAYIASSRNDNKADGVLVHDKDGKIILLVAVKENIESTVQYLIKNLEKKNKNSSLKVFEGLANPNEILILNNLGFQTIKFVESKDNFDCCFLVRKELQ